MCIRDRGRRLGQTEASDNRCVGMGIKSSIARSTVRRKSAKALRTFPSVSYYKRAKTVVEREHENATTIFAGLLREGENDRKKDARKGTRKNYEDFRRSLREGENGRKRARYTRDRKTRRQGGYSTHMPNSTRNQQSARVETGVNWRILE